ncbi:MAG TPA: hypothetical protein DEF47_22150 [Herpetosiphon sp.]|uniref:Uncharacterized protein n=1 Tax=Herpetosiphon aurantiacus (strain ATCC 23779 / DSM 785 / 114-95) TaxID=316274 RepID=A9AWP3_HERA2|nr:hypothetical protein [Herpetosiphon sp.]ABX03294.1 hypothetical protein Haur_0646 [Herpetosiphon aurantiacus DSM 785]HBW52592.1 hypothetical protein [Herpetosiphon sp.]
MVSYHRVRMLFALILLFSLCSTAPASSSQATSQALSHAVIDASGVLDNWQSLAIGSDGLGLIAYWDETAKVLKVAHCNDVACRTATITPLVTTTTEFGSIELTIGRDGLGKIIYNVGGQIFLAFCQNISCTSIQTKPIHSGGNSQLLIGSDSNPIIFSTTGSSPDNYQIKVSHCDDPQCQAITTTKLTDTLKTSSPLVAAIGSDGFPLILYYDNDLLQHMLIHCSDVACQQTTTSALPIATYQANTDSDMTIGSDGFPIITYKTIQFDQLGIIHCENILCTTYTNVYHDDFWLGTHPSVIINSDGLPLVSYSVDRNQRRDLYISRCLDLACNDITTHILDKTTWIGTQDMALGNDGLVLIAYHDLSRAQLRVIHCKDIACSEDGVNLFAQYAPMLMQTPTSMVVPINATAIPDQAVTTLGQVFFTTSISIPQPIPSGGRYVLAGNAQGTAPSIVDDKVVLKAGNQTIFEFEYGGTGTPNPTLVEVPNAIIESHIGQTITIEFRDVYGGRIQASTMYLVWIP